LDGWMDVRILNTHIKVLKTMKKPVLERLKMYFSVVLKEEAIVRNTTPSGI